jgi:hypothetical protein
VQVGAEHPLSGPVEQRLRGVDAGRKRSALGGHAQEDAGAAADVENALARMEAHSPDRLLVARQLLLLRAGPVVGTGSPEGTPALGASGVKGMA